MNYLIIINILIRIFLVGIFLITGIKSTLSDFNGFHSMVASKIVMFTTIITILALAIKILGSLFVIFDYYSIFGASILIIFTIIASILFHNPLIQNNQLNNLLKNLSIIGGLSLFIVCKLNNTR